MLSAARNYYTSVLHCIKYVLVLNIFFYYQAASFSQRSGLQRSNFPVNDLWVCRSVDSCVHTSVGLSSALVGLFLVHSSNCCSLCKTQMLSFSRQRKYTTQVRRKTLTFLYDKITPEDMYQILSKSIMFCRLYIKTCWPVFFFFLQCTCTSISICCELQGAFAP